MTVPYMIRLEPEQIEALRQVAQKERRSLTAQIAVALEEWLAVYTQRSCS